MITKLIDHLFHFFDVFVVVDPLLLEGMLLLGW